MPIQTIPTSLETSRLYIVAGNRIERAQFNHWIQKGIPDVFSIQEMDSGEEALLACTFTPPQIMLINQELSDMTGLTFLKKHNTTQFLSDPPFLLFIGDANEDLASQVIQLGAHEFFIKNTLSQEFLCRKIHSILGHVMLLQRLHELEYQFNTIFQSSVDALIVTSKDGHIQCANTAAEQLFQQSQCQLVGSFFEHPVSGEEIKEISIRGPKTESIPVEMRVVPIEWKNTPVYLISLHNLTERHKAEKERQRHETERQFTQRQESLGVLAGGVAHDFNNLLMSIVARAGLALRAIPQDSPAREHLKIIEKSGLRGGELANQMLTFAGQTQLEFQDVHLPQFLKDNKAFLRSSVSKRIQLAFNIQKELPAIRGDRSQLRQILMNVVTNAAEAIGEQDGTIQIRSTLINTSNSEFANFHIMGNLPIGHCVSLEVHDTGAGIAPELIPKIFDPFFSTKFPGRGLGLAALSGIIRGHGAAIAICSHIGEGTQFRILFPTTKKHSAKESSSLTIPKNPPRKISASKILVVDDEEEVRTACTLILNEIGFEALVAQDGQAGNEIFTRHQDDIALVFLDLTMPNVDGGKLAEAIREKDQHVPILVSSGYSEEEAMKYFVNPGIHAFIQKPFQVEIFIAKIQELTNYN